ncbi:MAG: hypothetical protein KA902_01090 [Arenimonas sp.]|nr:hypothetical protein [Arenimonas sp.]
MFKEIVLLIIAIMIVGALIYYWPRLKLSSDGRVRVMSKNEQAYRKKYRSKYK